MEPVTIVGLVDASLGLASKCGSIAQKLHDIAAKYQYAQLTTTSMASSLDNMRLAWSRIAEWSQTYQPEGVVDDDGFVERLPRSLEAGKMIIDALGVKLVRYHADDLGFASRAKFVWNENTLKDHQRCLMDQATSMTLLLQAMKLPVQQDRERPLQESEAQSRKSDESAYSIESIVPSSRSTRTDQRHSSESYRSQQDIEYSPLDCENELFMSKLYARSFKNVMIQEFFKARTQPKRKTDAIDQPLSDRATVEDQPVVEALIPSSVEASDNDTINTPKDHPETGYEFRDVGPSRVPIWGSRTQLFQAYEQGDNFRVKSLICEPDIHYRSDISEYAGLITVHVAAIHGHINVVKMLLRYGASVEDKTIAKTSRDPQSFEAWIETVNGLRPLHLAVRNKQDPMARFLVESGAEIAARAEHNVQPIHLAAACGSIEVLDLLIGAGAAIDASCERPDLDEAGWQPLHWAAATQNQSNIITYLLDKGADLGAQTSGGFDPLQVACLFDQVANVHTILARYDTSAHNGRRQSAFFYAIHVKAWSTIEWLLNDGIDPNCWNDGRTAIHLLSSSKMFESADVSETPSSTEKIFQLLLKRGANVDATNEIGNQALHLIADEVHLVKNELEVETKLARLLLDYGADIDAFNHYGMTPLYLALRRRKSQLSIMLIKSGASMLSNRRKKTTMVELPLDDKGDFTETELVKLHKLLKGRGFLL